MNPILKNILAVVSGLILGSVVNMAIIMVSGSLIPPPQGADVTAMEGLKASMHLFEPKHFIMPFLAHALGTLVGAYVTARIAASLNMQLAIVIGVVFLAGGIANVMMLPSPAWFAALDLSGAYVPVAYLAGKLAVKKS